MKSYKMEFPGAVLERGFWIYIWRITDKTQTAYYYVGRTGDNSSAKASSPFARIGQHLGKNQNSNAILKKLCELQIKPHECKFECIFFGPIAEEAMNWDVHVKSRDSVAKIEKAVADYLKEKELEVIGSHPRDGCELETNMKQTIDKWIAEGAHP